MSFARFGPQSYVYVFNHVHGGIECCGCLLRSEGDSIGNRFATPGEIVDHLQLHRQADHTIPDGLEQRILDAYDGDRDRQVLPTKPTVVFVGQEWRSTDPREADRPNTVVISVEDEERIQVRYAHGNRRLRSISRRRLLDGRSYRLVKNGF